MLLARLPPENPFRVRPLTRRNLGGGSRRSGFGEVRNNWCCRGNTAVGAVLPCNRPCSCRAPAAACWAVQQCVGAAYSHTEVWLRQSWDDLSGRPRQGSGSGRASSPGRRLTRWRGDAPCPCPRPPGHYCLHQLLYIGDTEPRHRRHLSFGPGSILRARLSPAFQAGLLCVQAADRNRR